MPNQLKMPKAIKESIIAPIPSTLIKQRDGGGGKMLSYISGSTVTDMLNKAFGYMWDWDVDKEWLQDGVPFFNKYSKLPDSEKVTLANGNRGSWEEQGPVAHVKGRLTVYFVDEEGKERKITKVGYGSKAVIGKQSEQDSIFKSAGTDALKKAASLLGIGLELYRDEDEQLYFYEMNYEDPWTDELKAKFKEERDYLRTIMETYSLEEEDFAPYINQFSEGALASLSEITPDNIAGFVEFMRSNIAAANGQEEALTELAAAEEEKPASPLTGKKK